MRASGGLWTWGDGIMENLEEAEKYHAHRAEVPNLKHAWKSSRRFIKIQASGHTPRISDLVGLEIVHFYKFL